MIQYNKNYQIKKGSASMRAFYRIYGKEGHRFRGSWQASTKINLDNGMTIETWCFDRTGSHDYADMEISCESNHDFIAPELYQELFSQLDDGLFEGCRYGGVEKLKYSYFWSAGCPTNKTFNEAVASYEHMLNCYAHDGRMIPYVDDKTHCYAPLFYGNKFTVKKEVLKWIY